MAVKSNLYENCRECGEHKYEARVQGVSGPDRCACADKGPVDDSPPCPPRTVSWHSVNFIRADGKKFTKWDDCLKPALKVEDKAAEVAEEILSKFKLSHSQPALDFVTKALREYGDQCKRDERIKGIREGIELAAVLVDSYNVVHWIEYPKEDGTTGVHPWGAVDALRSDAKTRTDAELLDLIKRTSEKP